MFHRLVRVSLAFAAVALGAVSARAQEEDPVRIGGVIIRTDGTLEVKFYDARLNAERVDAARASLSPEVAQKSELRKVSLNRLEKAVAARLAEGARLSEEMRALAGLTRVTHVFLYPDSGDVVIAGPAEAWAEDVSGRIRGVESGRPVVELADLVVALRAFPPGENGGPVIGCSIDATQQGLAAMQEYYRSLGGAIGPNDDVRPIVAGLKNALGMQEVTVLGVPAETHFAQVLVEADYRMKLIGIGLERPPVKMATYIGSASGNSRNAMQRWFFTPDYQCVRVSDDQLAMKLEGEGVKLVSADEIVAADGTRAASSSVDRASRTFVQAFTKSYARIAEKSPVYAQLRNLIDVSIVAAFVQEQDYYGKANWKMEVFASEEQFPVQTLSAPVKVDSAINALRKGSRWMFPIGGGVHIEPEQSIAAANLLPDEEGAVQQAREQTTLDHLQDGQWWWD